MQTWYVAYESGVESFFALDDGRFFSQWRAASAPLGQPSPIAAVAVSIPAAARRVPVNPELASL